MNERMKLLIAYDGSKYADAALDDLRRAGLPDEAEALVVTVADVFLPPLAASSGDIIESELTRRFPAPARNAAARAIHAVADARALAEQASERIRSIFPKWEVLAEAFADSPAWGVIKKADEWKPDLVVVGSQGRSRLGLYSFGSVSQKVVLMAPCSVRVARSRVAGSKKFVRIIIGVDGSDNAEAAVQAVAKRSWPTGSEVCVIAALDATLETAVELAHPYKFNARRWITNRVEAAVNTLQAAGLNVFSVIKKGDPKRVLLDQIRQWRADCLFVGSRGLRRTHRFKRFWLGSVSTAVAARVPCSVEIVRPK